MLYINVYLIGRLYGGPEEGGWWYDVGTPLASIPVDSDYQPGKMYYLNDGVKIMDCHTCSGTGKVAISDDSNGQPLMDRCQECGLIPEKPAQVWNLIVFWQSYFIDRPGRHEEIRVSLQEDFAQSFPESKPTYE